MYRISRSDHEGLAASEESNDYGTSGVGNNDGDYGGQQHQQNGYEQSGFQPSTGHSFGGEHQQQDYSQFTGFDHGQQGDHDGGFGGHVDVGHNYVHEHVEVTKPVAVPVYKEIGRKSFLF